MNKDRPQKNEIFLLLALNRTERANLTAPRAEDEFAGENLNEEDFPALFEQLSETQLMQFRRELSNYQNKNKAEREVWREKIGSAIGADEKFIDESVHRSHIENALKKEIPPIRKIISDALSNFETSAAENRHKRFLEKEIRRAFAAQFVSLREIENATAFDRLSGTLLARLIRLAGVGEVANACLRIEAVEAVAAFIRNFPAEDARMIAAQLGKAPEVSVERIAFAENLVHTAFEIEPNPSAMLDWLGIWLTGVLLCRSTPARIRYTEQKLPFEFALKLPEMIEEKCRLTPAEMQREIGGEIERLAVTIAGNA
ncbi:MAG TPA: hypothetical protein VGC76_11990 [Pyrinomonadaceae bacterium]